MASFIIVEEESEIAETASLVKIAGLPLIRRQIEILKNFSPSQIFVAYNDRKPLHLKDMLHGVLKDLPVQLKFIPFSGINELISEEGGPLFFIGSNSFFDADCIDSCISSIKMATNTKCFVLGNIHRVGEIQRVDLEIIANCKGFYRCIKSGADIKRIENFLYSQLISSTDSWLTKKINRRISIAITKKLANHNIHPNQITITNFFIGLLGVYSISKGGYFSVLFGTILFLLSSVLDGCDGELARLKFQKSKIGAYLDVITDNIVHWFLFTYITVVAVKKYGMFPYLPFGFILVASSIAAFVLSFVVANMCCATEGLLFSESKLSSVTERNEIVDKMANRDFAYLLVILAVFNHIEWFLFIGGPGSLVFAYLLYKSLKRKAML